jgi:splicing suppressor protein 51
MLLIDVYRLRMEQAYMYGGFVDFDGIYSHGEDGSNGLIRFLKLLEPKPDILPDWWSSSKLSECVEFGFRAHVSGSSWSDIALAIREDDVVEHYGDLSMPNQLRLFGEKVYGNGPGGSISGNAILAVHLAAEKE